jgi:hypothetical protein
MYEIPMTLGMVPSMVGELAAFHQLLTILGAVWLGGVAVLFLVIIPLAARSSETDLPSQVESLHDELRDAA